MPEDPAAPQYDGAHVGFPPGTRKKQESGAVPFFSMAAFFGATGSPAATSPNFRPLRSRPIAPHDVWTRHMNDSPADLDRYELVPGASEQRFSRFMRVMVRVMGNIFGATIFFVMQVLVKDNCHLGPRDLHRRARRPGRRWDHLFSSRKVAGSQFGSSRHLCLHHAAHRGSHRRPEGHRGDRPGLPRHLAVTLGPKGSELWIRGRTEVPRCALSSNNSKMVASIVYAGVGVPNRVPVPHRRESPSHSHISPRRD